MNVIAIPDLVIGTAVHSYTPSEQYERMSYEATTITANRI